MSQRTGGFGSGREVGDLLDQSSVCTALRGRDARAGMAREAAHMELVDHGLGKGPLERQTAVPVIAIGIGYDAFHGRGGIVAGPRRSPAVVCRGDRYGETVRVEEHLLGVEPISTLRGEGPVRPVGIHLARLKVRHKDMPVVIGAVLLGIERDDPCGLRGILVIEQKQLHKGRTLGEHAEVDAARAYGRAERSARTRCDGAGALRRRGHAYLSPGAIGLTFQMSRQYSPIERSEEKRPTRALLRIDMRVQLLRSAYASLARCWQST